MIKVKPSVQRYGLTPDLTPLLDIIFIVMVFLMLTAAVKLDALDVNLPSANNATTSEVTQRSMTINIQAQAPFWAINGTPYPEWNAFTATLLDAYKENPRPIVIGADKHADVQNLVRVLEFLQRSDIPATSLLTQDSPE